MKFSIIVPVYKVEDYLDRCVQSLLQQTYTDIEIILVDDGSPDTCPAMCDAYARSDARIKVIHKENGGLSDARNAGIAAAAGDYVMFVDSDDYISLDSCEKLEKYTHMGCDVLIADARVEGSTIDLTHIDSNGEVMSGIVYLKKAFAANKAKMAAWLNIFRRSFLLENGLRFKKGILHEDEEFTPRALLRAETVVVTGVEFYHYIVRENSIMTQSDKRRNARDLYSTCCELEPIFQALPDRQLRDDLLDSLVVTYLSLFYTGSLYRYGGEYYHRSFMLRNAKKKRTRCKAILYCVSPRVYCWINRRTKE